MTYVKQTWKNLPDQTTPITAARLNHLETQFDEARVYTDQQIAADVGAAAPTDPRLLPKLLEGRSVFVFAGSSTTARGGFVRAFMGHLWKAWRTGEDVTLSDPGTLGEGLHLVNAGVGNTTSDTYLTASTRGQINALNPVAVFHIVGSNDWYYHRSPATFAESLRTQIAGLSSSNQLLHVLVHQHERADMPPRSSAYTWDQYGDAMKLVASEASNRIYVDASSDMRVLGVGEGLSNAYGLLSPDNIHLSVSGEPVLGAVVAGKLGLQSGLSTGWVDLSSTLNPEFSFATGGRIVAKRSGDTVTFKADGIMGTFSSSSATTNIMSGVPSLFTPDIRAWGAAWGDSGTRVGVAVIREAGTVGVVFTTPPSQCQLTITYLV